MSQKKERKKQETLRWSRRRSQGAQWIKVDGDEDKKKELARLVSVSNLEPVGDAIRGARMDTQ